MAVIFCTRIMSEHKSWRAELNSLSYEVAGIPSQEMFMSWLKTFLLKVDEIRERNNGKSELVLSATRYIKNHCLEKSPAGKRCGKAFCQPQLPFNNHEKGDGNHLSAAYYS